MFETIQFEMRDQIAIITLNSPATMNALSNKMITDLHAALDEVEASADVRVLMIWGGQEKFFCAGGDLNDLCKSSPNDAYDMSIRSQRIYARFEALRIPTVAAVGGLAFGGGFEISLACDFRIITEKTKFGLTEVALGLIPGGAGTVRLPKLVGAAKAKELMFLGEIVRADDAMRLGIANRMAPVGELFEFALDFAQKLAKQAPISIASMKKLIREGEYLPAAVACELEATTFGLIFDTKDAKEGMAAFLEKREPKYIGK